MPRGAAGKEEGSCRLLRITRDPEEQVGGVMESSLPSKEEGTEELPKRPRSSSPSEEERTRMLKRLKSGGFPSYEEGRRRKLYLVLDDWELGYSIRKIDLLPDEDTDDPGCQVDDMDRTHRRTKKRLPPAVFRLQGPRGRSGLFAALGTKLIFMGARHATRTVPIYDVRTRALTSTRRRKWVPPEPSTSAYVEVGGNKLLVLDCGNFKLLRPPPPLSDPDMLYPPPAPYDIGQFDYEWDWSALEVPPYHEVISYALHPNERTIFFSMEKFSKRMDCKKLATWSFNTETLVWTRLGKWGLPFQGRGYFDSKLDAFVGLSSDDPDTRGHLCACKVLSEVEGDNGQPPSWKVSKEKVFVVYPGEKHVSANLVYMSGFSRFCLMQVLSIDDWRQILPDRCHYLLRVATLSLEYDKNGDLRATQHRHVGTYRLPGLSSFVYCDPQQKPVAFWI